jgi:large subunit ribosomal protein L17
MRHGKKINHLGRNKAHREALLSNMAVSLIMHKRIKTTVAKAKALKVYVEPLITKSKDDSTHSRRVVFSYLQNKEAVTELFRDVSVKVADRPGGYTRILKTGARLGDNAEMCIIELVDYNENMLTASKEAQAKTTRRSRRGGSKKADPAVAPAAKESKAAKEEPKVAAEAVEVTEQEVVKTEVEVEAPEVVEEVAEVEATAETEVAEVAEVAEIEAAEVVDEATEEVKDSAEAGSKDDDEAKEEKK